LVVKGLQRLIIDLRRGLKVALIELQQRALKIIDLHEGRSKALKDITLVFGCRNLVLASPHTASGETAAYVTWVVAKKGH